MYTAFIWLSSEKKKSYLLWVLPHIACYTFVLLSVSNSTWEKLIIVIEIIRLFCRTWNIYWGYFTTYGVAKAEKCRKIPERKPNDADHWKYNNFPLKKMFAVHFNRYIKIQLVDSLLTKHKLLKSPKQRIYQFFDNFKLYNVLKCINYAQFCSFSVNFKSIQKFISGTNKN